MTRLLGLSALVIGYGSIGHRHADVLAELGCRVGVVSRRAIDATPRFGSIETALAEHRPEYVVVATETGGHGAALATLAACGYAGQVTVEKPLLAATAALPEHRFSGGYVAYNLRFHPIIVRLRAMLESTRIISCNAYVGQYLPDWRPQTDYRQCYSAKAAEGGGVLRDLSHELDYLNWILGGWRGVAALGGHFSDLDIDSEDVFALLMTTPRCPVVSVQLNYLDRTARRHIVVNTDQATIVADLVQGTLRCNGVEEHFETERNTTYRQMHLAILSGHDASACTFAQGMETLSLIEGAARAARSQQWIFQ